MCRVLGTNFSDCNKQGTYAWVGEVRVLAEEFGEEEKTLLGDVPGVVLRGERGMLCAALLSTSSTDVTRIDACGEVGSGEKKFESRSQTSLIK
jgi:hypothetical protein